MIWRELNAFLLTATEEECREMLKKEKNVRVSLRIHARMNKLRAARERDELSKGSKLKLK